MAYPIGEEARRRILETYEATGSVRRAAAAAGVGFGAARRALRRAGVVAASPGPGPEVTRSEGENEAEIRFDSDTEIRTLDEAVAFAKVDLSVWRVDRWECGGHSVVMKVATRDAKGKVLTEAPVKKQAWRVRLYLKRLLPRDVRSALDGVFARLRADAPAFPAVRRPEAPGGPHSLILDLVDVHFGKLCWGAESGQSYDLRIAERVYLNAVEDLLDRASRYDVAEFVVPLGSDFLHVDNAGLTTARGTPQDVDGRLPKILEVAKLAVVRAVEAMAARGRVRLVWVPGNHDWTLSYCLAMTVHAWFHHAPHVEVDYGPSARKYHRFGRCLIGLTHGDQEKHASLPVIMATERPADWAASDTREWHVGHHHKSKRVDYLGLDTHGGVPVRTLRSLSAVDAWHYRQGYVGTSRSAEAYLYSERGYVGHFVADARE